MVPISEVITIWFLGAIAVAVSAAVLAVQHIHLLRCTRARLDSDIPKSYAPIRSSPIFKYRALRVLACFIFSALTFVSLAQSQFTDTQEIIASTSILFIACLSAISLKPSARLSNIANRHSAVLLLVFFGIYAYRDLWPLFTFDEKVQDIEEGWILWFKLTTLTLAAIVIPLMTPRHSYPPSIEQVASEINPEETASLLSVLTHSYLDSFIFQTYRATTHLDEDGLPPLTEADHSDVFMPDVLAILDSSSRNPPYLFWGLVKAYKARLCMLTGLYFVQTGLSFVAPYGIKRVLSYLESNGEGATIRPWVFVSLLFIGPFLKATFSELYTYIAGRNQLQIIGILTQLILGHALKMRIDSDMGAHLPQKEGEQKERNFTGRINNLATSDILEVARVADSWIGFLCFPFDLGLSLWFLHEILDYSAFVGFGFMLLCIPIPGYITRILRGVQISKKKKTDARVQTVTESLSVIRMAKLFGWKMRLQSQIASKRAEELSYIKKSKLYSLLNTHTNLLIPMCTMMITYTVYTLVQKKELTASVVFSSIAVFEMLRDRIGVFVTTIPTMVTGKVALDRLDDFLRKTKLLDRFGKQQLSLIGPSDPTVIGFRDAEFRWLDSSNNFKLKFEGEVLFRQNCVNLILGSTGAGKTSLLLALLGEMRFFPTSPSSYFNLPRQGGVSYAAQESWIQNDTIKNNILFGSKYDRERYESVLYQCALLKDLALFETGDMTEVGEKGLTLSGGQKARVTLARAVYSSASIVLLDDPLSALDVHTAKWVVEKCLEGPLMKGRTVLLVTHNIALTSPIAGFSLAIALDGTITQGAVNDVILNNRLLAAHLAEEEKALRTEQIDGSPTLTAQQDPTKPHGGLIVAEEIPIGRISWNAFKLYLSNLNRYPVVFFWSVFSLVFLDQLSYSVQTWFLGYWSSQYDSHTASSVNVSWFLSVYTALLLTSMVLYSSGYTLWIFGSMRASQILHSRFIESIMSSTFRWLDTTPTSRIVTRATVDMSFIDDSLAFGFWRLFEISIILLVRLGSVVIFSPIFSIPGVAIGLLGGYMGQVFLTVQLPLRRLVSTKRAPVLGHFTAAIAGLVSIRAYGAEDAFLTESRARIDTWILPPMLSNNLNRWVAVRADTLSGIFAAGLGAYLVYGHSGASAANTGFSMSMAVGFTSYILIWVRLFNITEVQANSLERLQYYLNIEHEEKGSSEGVPPAYWPASGALNVDGLRARYSKDGPEVLHGLTFTVRSGERIGIVGRTGSGKSSLTLALLRAIPTSGQVLYDGVPTHRINLDALRSHITIIPQVPELLSGSLRSNLDPFSEHDDSRLNDALRSAGLFSLQSGDAQNKLGLDSEIGSGGANLSVGQRQIIALARAIVRGSKLFILDEATSSIDHKTDSIIQETLRHELGEVSYLVVAHRLRTIMDFDRIMVLDEGRIAEFDSPKSLLQKEGGMFRALVDESADKDELYAFVKFA